MGRGDNTDVTLLFQRRGGGKGGREGKGGGGGRRDRAEIALLVWPSPSNKMPGQLSQQLHRLWFSSW